jgi:hypothetical protein
VRRLAFGQERGFGAVFSLAQDAVSEPYHGAAHHRGPGFDEDFFVVVSRRAVAAPGLDHRQNAMEFALQQLVRKTESAEELDAANLKPDQVVGVVDNAHLVCFGVADSNFGGHGHEAISLNV